MKRDVPVENGALLCILPTKELEELRNAAPTSVGNCIGSYRYHTRPSGAGLFSETKIHMIMIIMQIINEFR